jgi:hypothetical protein
MNGIVVVIYLAIVVLLIAAAWQIFTKAGEAGWKCLIPIYNTLVLLKIVGRDWWWILLLLIPILNIVIWLIIALDLAKSFGKGGGFGVGLFFLSFIFGPILGFGSATYVGPGGQRATA